jgi:hypothetical protein
MAGFQALSLVERRGAKLLRDAIASAISSTNRYSRADIMRACSFVGRVLACATQFLVQ